MENKRKDREAKLWVGEEKSREDDEEGKVGSGRENREKGRGALPTS